MIVVMLVAAVVIIVVTVIVVIVVYKLVNHGASGLHGLQYLPARKLIPRRSDNGNAAVVLPEQGHRSLQLLLRHILGAAEDYGVGALHLVVVKFTEVLHIHFALARIGNGHKAVKLHWRVRGHALDRLYNVGKLAHAGRLYYDSVRMEFFQHLPERRPEIPHQRTAYAAGVHLGYLHAGILQKSAVDAYLAELVFNKHYLLALESLSDKLFNKRGLSGPEETGNNIYLCHGKMRFLSEITGLARFICF